MSILTYPLGFIGGGKEFYNGVIENSIKLNNDADNAHVRFPVSTTGNRRTFTWSGWIKSARINGTQDGTLFGAQNDTHNSSSVGALRFAYPNDSLNVLFNGGSGGTGGGGNGGHYSQSGKINTGRSATGHGNGGGGGGYTYGGGAGSGGIVIIRYSGGQRGSGGSVSTSGGFTRHTFNSAGSSSTFTA